MTTKFTIHDIARLSGVSTGTVSRVLNQSARVDPTTRERVLQVIKTHQFVPSMNARGLKGQSQLIGLLMPMLNWTSLLEVIWTVTTYMSEHTNYGIMLYTCPVDKDYSIVVEQILKTKLVAGLLAMVYDQSPAYLETLYKQGVPLVLIDPIGMQADLPLVGVDHRGGAYEAVRHLLALGHTRIAYIQGPLEYPCSFERYQGYCTALEEAGLTPDPQLFRQGSFDRQSGMLCAQGLLLLPDRPTAIFAFDDDLAYGALQAAEALHLRVPTELAVVGFNDDRVFDSNRSMFTTVRQPFADMGRCASDLLLSLVNPQRTVAPEWLPYAVSSDRVNQTQPETSPLPYQFQLPTHLVVRESSQSILLT